MNTSKQWVRILMAFCIFFSFIGAREGRAQSVAMQSGGMQSVGTATLGVVVRSVAAACGTQFGELQAAAAECVMSAVTPTQLEACLADETANERCFGGNDVMLGWVLIKRDMQVLHRSRSLQARAVPGTPRALDASLEGAALAVAATQDAAALQ